MQKVLTEDLEPLNCGPKAEVVPGDGRALAEAVLGGLSVGESDTGAKLVLVVMEVSLVLDGIPVVGKLAPNNSSPPIEWVHGGEF